MASILQILKHLLEQWSLAFQSSHPNLAGRINEHVSAKHQNFTIVWVECFYFSVFVLVKTPTNTWLEIPVWASTIADRDGLTSYDIFFNATQTAGIIHSCPNKYAPV